MTALFRTELRRLLARRLFRWLTSLVLLGFVVAAVVAFLQSGDDVGSTPFRFEQMETRLVELSGLLVVIGWVVGASAIGAEWPHRTIPALLTWEPRRSRVLLAKLLAACVVAFLLAVFLEAAFTAVFLPAGQWRGTFAGIDASWWVDTVSTAARIAGVAAFGAAAGFSLAAIGKNTAAALGAGFVYLAIVETMVRVYRPEWLRWLIGDNMSHVLTAGEGFGGPGHSVAMSALILAGYAAGVSLLGLWFFRRREMA